MQITKLLTIFLIVVFLYFCQKTLGQCMLIGGNGSAQDPSSLCAPVDFTMHADYQFMVPVDPSLVKILFRWNDGTGATDTLSGNWNAAGDSVYVSASHNYPPTDECSRTAEAILIYDGELCMSSGYQEQTFATWGTDEENSGILNTNPVVHYVCEGEDVIDFTFADNSTFNCNITIEPDRPNRYYRWVQFIYNTYNQGGDRIPNVTVRDAGGTVHNMTDAIGNNVGGLDGPILRIPIPADGPNQISFEISAPAGGVAGDIFEITMRNWNVCNPYDETPNDGNPPADAVNGDNTPIETTARIEIIAPPPLTYTSLYEFCTNDNFILSASAGTGDVRWYKDSTLDTLLHTGNTFNPSFSPYPVNPNIPGSYSFYVTSYEGFCESAPGVVNMIVYQSPETANAGLDQTICADSITLTANTPTAGTAVWSTTSSATIVNLNDSVTRVRDLEFGPNTFTWTITNAFCSTTDNVTITSDRKPSDADAGSDVQICDTNQIILDATPVDLAGSGLWDVIAGSGTVTNPTSAGSSFSNMSQGNNRLIWRAYSMYNACPVTIDTLEILLDLSAGVANAGIDRSFCETDQTNLSATGALNGGFGNWSVLSGAGTFTNAAEENSSVTNLNYGSNIFQWEISSLYGICPSDSDVVEVINYQSPGIADAGSDAAYCLVTTDTLDGNTPVAGNGSWHIFQNPSGVAPSFLPNNSAPNARISISPGNEGKYGLIWQLQNGSCLSFDTVFIDFGVPVPQANAGPDTISCGYSYAMQANSFSRGVGTWTYLNGPGSVAMNPNEYTANAVFSFTPGNEGFYEFEWELTSGACPPSRDTILIGIKEAPLAPVLTDYQTCGPDSFSINVATADIDHIVYWYESNTSATPFYVGNTFGTGILSNTSDYYVSIYDTLSDCESSREEQLITVDIIPDAPNMLADTLCGSGNASLLGIPVLPANLVIWYEDSEGTIPADSGLTYNTPVINSSGYFYSRAQNTNTGCISEVDSVEVKVWPDTPSPTVSTDSSCGPSDFILHATKNESENALFWYKPDGSLTGISDSLVTAVINSTQSYFVSEYDIITKCLSEQVELVVTINSLPPLPTISDTFNCGPSEFTLKPSANPRISDFYWYDSPVEGNLISIADSFQTDFLISGESYWISGYNSITGCEGSRKEVEVDIFPSPSVIDIIGPTVMLRDQSNVLFFTQGGRSTSDYTWTIPSGVDFEQDVNDFIRLGFPNIGTYTISVFETTEDGCIGEPAYHNITVLLDSIAVDIGDFQQGACTAESFEIKPWLYGGAPPYTYHWTGDIEYLSSTSDFFTTFSPPGTGNYKLYLEVIDLNLKVARDSVSITVFESPTTNILNTDTIACVGENYSIITAQTGAQPFTYLWTGPVHNLNNYAVSNPVYTPRQSDTVEFTYILTDAHKCKAYDTITIISDKPTADFSVLTLPGCSPLNVEFENNSKGATRYNWYFGDGTQTTATEPSHAYANTSVEIKYYDVKLVATSALGCTDEEIEYVMVWPNPKAEITALPQTGCNPANVMLVSTPGNSLYHWNFGDTSNDTSTTRFSVTHTFTNTSFEDQIFEAQVVTQSSLNCYDTADIDITVYATPVAEFEVTPGELTFPESEFSINNLTEGSWKYTWDYGDGRGSTLQNPGNLGYDAPGNYTITLRVNGDHCSDSATAPVRIHPAPPVAGFKGADNGCMPHTVTLVNESRYVDSYLWDFGDGSISTAKDPSYTYYEPGIYKIKLTVSGAGGTASYSDTTNVYVLPNSYFEVAPRYVYVNDEPVHYFNLSDQAEIFEWDFGDGATSEELSPQHLYKEAGTYDVTLKVWTLNGCFDLYIMENAVFAEASGLVEFPNAFRPQSPIEENQVFKPGIIDRVDDYHLMIFNRWGEMIFESFDQEIGWDGYYKGEVAKQDVYIWKVSGTYTDGRGFEKTGDVTLMH